ncbi:hypothetical protein TKK_0012907 [Trichogramma kaykai]|uniref:Transcriptional adapter 3-like n=1 Tax=Trichogramma kaykai TaxID=54128 RepID=A0ABD2WMJ9_9HYME
MSGKGKQNSKKAMVKSGTSRESGGKLSQQLQQPSTPLAADHSSSDSSEATITLPVIKMIDNSKLLPRYTSILERTAEEGITMEDLDILQNELETLLSATVVRSRLINEEIINLNVSEEKRDKRSKASKSLTLVDKKSRDEKLKPKELGLKSHSPLPTKLMKQRAAGSSATQVVPNPHEIIRVEGSKLDGKSLLPKNDTLNKFWASVEPYCGDITSEDIKLLQDLIAHHSDLGEFKKIPPLGRHYTMVWAEQELMQEEEAGRDPNNTEKKKQSDVTRLLSKVDKKSNGISGPLTQRLVSALLEENVYVANNNADNKLFRDGDPPVLRDLSIQNSMNLEMRMHKELVEQGILDAEPQKKNPEEDEILMEIKRCQRELIALSSHNEQQLKKLLQHAKDECKRQELKRKISTVDNEVVENYTKLVAAKQRKVPLTKKDQEKAWASLKEREQLLEQLNSMPPNDIGEPVVVKPNLDTQC